MKVQEELLDEHHKKEILPLAVDFLNVLLTVLQFQALGPVV